MKTNATTEPSETTALNLRHAIVMRFNVIVTFQRSNRTVEAIKAMEEQELLFTDSQIIFECGICISSTCSYDSVMLRLHNAVITETTDLCGLGKSDICKISTCGDWKLWECVTGLCEETEAARSKVAHDGNLSF